MVDRNRLNPHKCSSFSNPHLQKVTWTLNIVGELLRKCNVGIDCLAGRFSVVKICKHSCLTVIFSIHLPFSHPQQLEVHPAQGEDRARLDLCPRILHHTC